MKNQTAAAKIAFQRNPVISFSPILFNIPGRGAELQIKVSAPATGNELPVILFSHGGGTSDFLFSMRGYGPVADYFASQGFVVIQPTHENSKALALDPTGPEGPMFWKSRAIDMRFILDHLSEIEAAVPTLKGRMNKTKIAAVGHSLGGHTVAMLAGMRMKDVEGQEVSFDEPVIQAFVIISAPGDGADLGDWASAHFAALKGSDFSRMKREALVVAGDKDYHAVFSARENWRSDAYYRSPGAKCLLTVFGGEHGLGGIMGYDSDEKSDNPEMLLFVLDNILAYLQTKLFSNTLYWENKMQALHKEAQPLGKIECKEA